jgi:aryl-alcohol dehydrogenase
MQIQAAVFRDTSGKASLETIDLEEPRDDEIVVRVVGAGICHTDITVSRRDMAPRPIVLGHEGSGIVERVGARVTKVTPGDHVVMTYDACLRCPPCLSGNPVYCDETAPRNFGSFRPDKTTPMSKGAEKIAGQFFGQSSFATLTIGTERNVVKVGKDVPIELLGPLGCGIQTGAGAVLNALKVGAGQTIAVFGTGSVGLSAVMAARVAGAGRIIAIDVKPSRLQMAAELGATDCVNGSQGDTVAAIKRIVPRGVDAAFDTTGVAAVVQQAVACLDSMGTAGCVAPPPEPVGISIRDMLRGKKLMGILEGESVPDIFIPALIDLYKQGRFPIDRLVRYYEFTDINRAIHDSEDGTTIKPILKMPS